jgi:hypothetical protein
MIVSTFKTGTGKASGPLNYLLKKHNRNPPAEIFQGDSKLLQVLIDSNPRKFKYSSGVIAFRDNEQPTDEQLRQIVRAFEKTFKPALDSDRVPLLWVLHRDKGNTELHFLAPMQDAKTGKQFNICPPGKAFQQMYRDFQTVANHRYGWEQVPTNLLRSEFSRFDEQAKLKEQFCDKVPRLAKSGKLKNREDLLEWLKPQGFTVTRLGNDYVSLKHSTQKKAFRLKGTAFTEGADYQSLLATSEASKQPTDEEIRKAMARLTSATKNRTESLLEHLEGIPRTTKPLKEQAKERAEALSGAEQARQFFTISKPDVLQRMKAMEEARQPTATADPPQSSKPKGFKL